MMNNDLTPIAVPPDWSAEKDIEEYIDRFGEADDYFEEVGERVEAAHHNLQEAINLGLRYFGEEPAAISAKDLSGKIASLWNHLLRDPQLRAKQGSPEEYVTRFEGHLAYCRFAQTEYERIAPMLDRMNEDAWLFPFVDLSDHLNTAAFQLEEALACEHHDFRQVVGEPDWRIIT